MLLLHILHHLHGSAGADGARREWFEASFRVNALYCEEGVPTALVSPCWFFAWLVFGILQPKTSSNNGIACGPMYCIGSVNAIVAMTALARSC